MSIPDSVSRKIVEYVPQKTKITEWNKIRLTSKSYAHIVSEERRDRNERFYMDIFILEKDEMINKYIHSEELIIYMVMIYPCALSYILLKEPQLIVTFAKRFIKCVYEFKDILDKDQLVLVLVMLIHLEEYKLATDLMTIFNFNDVMDVIEFGKYEEIDIGYFSEFGETFPYFGTYQSYGFLIYKDNLLNSKDNYSAFRSAHDEIYTRTGMSLLGRLFTSYAKNKESNPIKITLEIVKEIISQFDIHQIVYAIYESVLYIDFDFSKMYFTDTAFDRYINLISYLYQNDEIVTYKAKEYSPRNGLYYRYGVNHTTPHVISKLLGLSVRYWVDIKENPNRFDFLFNLLSGFIESYLEVIQGESMGMFKISNHIRYYTIEELNMILHKFEIFGVPGSNDSDEYTNRLSPIGGGIDVFEYLSNPVVGEQGLAINSHKYNMSVLNSNMSMDDISMMGYTTAFIYKLYKEKGVIFSGKLYESLTMAYVKYNGDPLKLKEVMNKIIPIEI
jgi:hypothetical protein